MRQFNVENFSNLRKARPEIRDQDEPVSLKMDVVSLEKRRCVQT